MVLVHGVRVSVLSPSTGGLWLGSVPVVGHGHPAYMGSDGRECIACILVKVGLATAQMTSSRVLLIGMILQF